MFINIKMPREDFKVDDCLIPSVYCGKGNIPRKKGNKRYVRRGTASECLVLGIGAGIYQERNKNLDRGSVMNIKYVGDYYERKFRNRNIRSISDLKRYVRNRRSSEIKGFLEEISRNRQGRVDKRVFNSVVLFLYLEGVYWVPDCKYIRSNELVD